MKQKYDILVKWEKYPRELRPIETIEKITMDGRNYELRFEYEGKEYKYEWQSNSMQGLAWLSDFERCIYNPYKDNDPEAVALMDAAVQLCGLIKKAKH